jgi:uncharacterized tellurite resistance protein B-like protein
MPKPIVDAIRRLFAGKPHEEGTDPAPAPSEGPDRLQVAACGLLLAVAYADDEFAPEERARIEQALERHFGLDPTERAELIALAEEERRRAIDDFHLTRVINEHYDLGQKMLLAELMWGIILADGEVAKHESYLVRKLANLLDLAPAYLSQARRRATNEE